MEKGNERNKPRLLSSSHYHCLGQCLSWWGLMLSQQPSVKKRLICKNFCKYDEYRTSNICSIREQIFVSWDGYHNIFYCLLLLWLSILMVLENQLRWDRDNLHLVTLTCKKWLKILLRPFHIWQFHPALGISCTSENKIRTR